MQKLTRSEAKAQGLTRYFTGKPCKHGHVEERMVSSGACMACKERVRKDWASRNQDKESARNARWAKNNPEKVKAKAAKWRSANAAKIAERQRKYRAENLEKEMARQAAWLAANKPKMRSINSAWYADNRPTVAARDARRRANRERSIPAWDGELTEFVTKEAVTLSKQREAATALVWHIDHMIPLKAKIASGLHVWSNLQVIPAVLNAKKHNRLVLTAPGEWIRHL